MNKSTIIAPHEFIDGKMPCGYCEIPAELVDASKVYIKAPAVDQGRLFWRCPQCGAYVGCHLGTNIPLGTLARERLRNMRRMAHYHFDKLWETPRERKAWYKKMADYMGLAENDMHIAWLDDEQILKFSEYVQGEFSRRVQAGERFFK